MSGEPGRDERINRFLARCGVASRRGADQLIEQGRVRVNDRVAHPGQRVDPGRDRVAVDGKPIRPAERTRVLMLYKPRGVVSTVADPKVSKTLRPWLEKVDERLYPVGRLDRDSEGLLLLTNDGELTQRLTHPRHHVEKEYRVTILGHLTDEHVQRLTEGVELDDGPTLPARVMGVDVRTERTRFTIILREGRGRQIRRMCEALGYSVLRLIRRRIGPLEITNLKPGQVRPLTTGELHTLRLAAGLKDEYEPPNRKRRGASWTRRQ